MGQNQVITIASSLQYLWWKGIGKFIFFWLCVVSLVKKNKHESPSFLFQLLQNFKSGSIVLGDLFIGERFGVLF
jgi:hypothetical protein